MHVSLAQNFNSYVTNYSQYFFDKFALVAMKATFTSGIRCNFMLMLSECDLVTNIPSIPTTDVDFRIRFDFLAYLFYILSVCMSFLGLASIYLSQFAHKDNEGSQRTNAFPL